MRDIFLGIIEGAHFGTILFNDFIATFCNHIEAQSGVTLLTRCGVIFSQIWSHVLAEIGMIWRLESKPTEGLNPTIPFMVAGQIIEPLVSVPMARGANCAAIAAPEPDDEPHGVRSKL